jgi:hypothetical protein
MQKLKTKDICNCDVRDKELLARFRERLKHWKACLSDEKDYHSVYNQLTTLFWDHAVYRTFNEARRLSEETNDPSTGLQGTIIDLLDRNFMDSQAIAIRRLTDARKDVISLRSLINDIKENIGLYVRENYVCYDGISFDEAHDDDLVGGVRNSRQICYDYLSGKDKDNRSRNDKLSPAVLAKMEEDVDKDFKIAEEVRLYVNKWVAHAADPNNRDQHIKVLDNISLHKLDQCYQTLIRIGKKVELLIDGFLLCSVPTPQFNQFNNWDKPIITTKEFKALREYWTLRCEEIEDWSKEATIIR